MKQWKQRLHQCDAQLSAQVALSPAAQQQRGRSYWLALVGAHLGDSWLWGVVAAWEWMHVEQLPSSASPDKGKAAQKVADKVRPAMPPVDPPRAPLIRRWLLALFVAYLANLLLKQTIKRARPSTADFLYGLGPDGYSFPSGHAMRMGVIITWSGVLWPRWSWLAWPLTLWISWSRVRLGVHYVGDVVVGLGLGWLIGHSLRR